MSDWRTLPAALSGLLLLTLLALQINSEYPIWQMRAFYRRATLETDMKKTHGLVLAIWL